MAFATNKKSTLSSIVAIMLIMVLVFQSQTYNVKAQAQNSCSASLGNLNVCAPFVVPGALNTNPSPDCCNALQAIDHDCLCNSLRVTARLPTQCNLPSISCSVN